MRKLKEAMRLRIELHLSYQQIGRSCAIGVSTAHKYLKRIEAAGLTRPSGPKIGSNWIQNGSIFEEAGHIVYFRHGMDPFRFLLIAVADWITRNSLS